MVFKKEDSEKYLKMVLETYGENTVPVYERINSLYDEVISDLKKNGLNGHSERCSSAFQEIPQLFNNIDSQISVIDMGIEKAKGLEEKISSDLDVFTSLIDEYDIDPESARTKYEELPNKLGLETDEPGAVVSRLKKIAESYVESCENVSTLLEDLSNSRAVLTSISTNQKNMVMEALSCAVKLDSRMDGYSNQIFRNMGETPTLN